MEDKGAVQRRNRRAGIAVTAVVLVLVALSPAFGRADPQAGFRPPLPADALTNGCYPLPDGLRLTFPYQVRLDGDTATRDGRKVRTLVLQYDLLDDDAIRTALTDDLARAGYRRVDSGASAPAGLSFARAGNRRIEAVLIPFSPPYDAGIVRGSITLTLPRVAVASDAPVCSDPNSTKRFPPGEPTLGTLP